MTLNKDWRVRDDVSALGADPAPPLRLRPLTQALLKQRGYDSPGEQRDFLSRKDLRALGEFWDLPDMAAGVAAIREAIAGREKICVYGDYDADGMTAAALLIKALRSLGSEADSYIPHRLREGYGLHRAALERIRERGASLVVTVDCGVSAAAEAAYAKSLGLKLVVTDHHRPGAVLPEALALIDPELMPAPGRHRGLGGAGVAFALAVCLFEASACPGDTAALAQLAAIGILADGVPLAGDNRILAAAGLAALNTRPLPGIAALLRESSLSGKPVEAGHVAFQLAPRLNAAGRLADPDLGLSLLLAADGETADLPARRLGELNRLRRDVDAEIYGEAVGLLAADTDPGPVLVLAGEGWHPGVIGITAARLLEKYRRPVVLISFEDGQGRGSARSLPGCDMHEALTAAGDLLIAWGGHELACGLTVARENLAAFRQRMRAYAETGGWRAVGEEAGEGLWADLVIAPDQLSLEAVDELEALAPFGPENPRPLLVLPSMCLTDFRHMGQEKQHARFFFRPSGGAGRGRAELTALAFSLGDDDSLPVPGRVYDLLFEPELDHWQGRRSVRLMLRGCRETAPSAPDRPRPATPAPAPSGPPSRELCRQSILGDRSFRPKQIEALDALAAGQNTLLVMATGRGKTAVFQTAAASLEQSQICIIVYPLRSLARDQERRMEKSLAPLGVRTALAWGGLDHWEKKEFFKGLYQGRIRLVIATAEFIQAHLDKFQQIAGRLGLFVVDEAHHLDTGHREAYKNLGQTWRKLGSPLFLATTATAGGACADKISREFAVERLITEDHCRENLALADARQTGSRDKLAYLLALIRPESKAIVYVNSRRLTEELAEALRDSLPWMAEKIGSYHGGLLPEARRQAERAFLTGVYSVMVSTAAFGEGVDIPDIRDVVLYHLCFSRAEYNQLSGRAGRDGQPARIHLLYGEKDKELNRLLLREEAPDRDTLGSFYLLLREKAALASPLSLSDDELAGEMVHKGYGGFSPGTALCCLGILEDLDLLLREDLGGARRIHLAPPPPAKLNLAHSSLYAEGLEAVRLFEEYLALAFSADLNLLLDGINRPILPERRRGYA